MDSHESLVCLHIVLTSQEESHTDKGYHQKSQVDVVESETNINLRIVNPSFPCIDSLNLTKSNFKESCVKGERFFKLNFVVALGGNSSRAGEPEKNSCVDSYLENETLPAAHPFVIRVSSEFKLLGSHPISPGKYKLSNVEKDFCEGFNNALGSGEVKELLLEWLYTTEVDRVLYDVFNALAGAVAHEHNLHVVKQKESSAKACSDEQTEEKAKHDHVNSNLHTSGFQVDVL